MNLVNVSCSSPLALPLLNVSQATPSKELTTSSVSSVYQSPNNSFEFVNVSCSSPLAIPLLPELTEETPMIKSISGSVHVKVIKKKLCLLKQIGMKNVSELTPRKGKLYATAKK